MVQGFDQYIWDMIPTWVPVETKEPMLTQFKVL